MNAFIKNPIVVGILVFLFSIFLIGKIAGPATCRDGWHSASIGLRGACSHHGGVGGGWGGIVAVFLGVASGLFRYVRNEDGGKTSAEKNKQTETPPTILPEPRSGPADASKPSEIALIKRAAEGQKKTDDYLQRYFDFSNRAAANKPKSGRRPPGRKR